MGPRKNFFKNFLLVKSSRTKNSASNTSPPTSHGTGAPSTQVPNRTNHAGDTAAQPTGATQQFWGASKTTGSSSVVVRPHISVTTPTTPNVIVDPALCDTFKRAIEQYIAKLSNEDKDSFRSKSLSNVMGEIHAFNGSGSKIHISSSLSGRVEKVLQCVKHFIGSIGIFIQHSPDISSLVVGGMNCVLLLVLGYIEFFDKLTEMIERIGEHLDYLSLYGSAVFQRSPDVQMALVQAYCDLLEFFVRVRVVFADKEGKTTYLQGFKLFLKLTWEPFELKFKPLEDRFLHHTLVVIRSANVQHLVKTYEEKAQLDVIAEFKKRREILQWLCTDDMESTHERHYKKRLPTTGQWLLDTQEFRSWRDAVTSGLLWCHGTPGAGKTILAALVIEHLSSLYELSNSVGVMFLYCNYKENREATVYIRLAMKQLCRRLDNLPTELENIHNKHDRNASEPTLDELRPVFAAITKQFNCIFLVLDALDECTDEQRKDMVDFLKWVIVDPGTMDPPSAIHDTTTITHSQNQGTVKLFVTSRKEPDISRAFRAFPKIEIEAKTVDKDIEVYVSTQLEQRLQDGRLRLRDGSLKHKILRTLIGKSNGMFLWADFQLTEICAQVSDRGVETALQELPETMDETYERILSLILSKPKPQQRLARKVIMWIAYAQKPLPMDELCTAIAINKGTKGLDQLIDATPAADTVLDVCPNLILCDNQGLVRFVHYSVQEFFTSGRSEIARKMNIDRDLIHGELAQACVTFLLMCYTTTCKECFSCTSQELLVYPPFSEYAVTAWLYHIRGTPSRGLNEEFVALIDSFFVFGPMLFLEEGTRNMCWVDQPVGYVLVKNDREEANFSPRTLALIFNLPDLASRLLELKGGDGTAGTLKEPNDSFAMHYALSTNFSSVVSEVPGMRDASLPAVTQLYTHGYPIDASGHDGLSPLLVALSRGMDIQLIKFLLDNGADVNKRTTGGLTSPLHIAVSLRSSPSYMIEVVKLLLDRGADIHCRGKCGTVLQAACANPLQSLEVVRTLLEKHPDVNAVGGHYGSALEAACTRRFIHSDVLRIVNLLLDSGADPNLEYPFDRVSDQKQPNALQAALLYGPRLDMVALLLESGAEVNAQGGYFGNSLQAAIYGVVNQKQTVQQTVEALQILLDRGAAVNLPGGEYGNALQLAASTGHAEIVHMLLMRGPDVKARGGKYGSALQAASCSRGPDVVQIVGSLLDRGAEVNADGGKYGNALQAAVYRCNIQLVQLLLDRGADVGMCGGKYSSALQAACCPDGPESLQVVELLLERGAEVNAHGGKYGTALQAAAYRCNIQLVQLLLNHGADVNMQGGEYGTPLQAAAQKIKLDADSAEVRGPRVQRLIEIQKQRALEVVRLLIGRGGEVKEEWGLHKIASLGLAEAVSQHTTSMNARNIQTSASEP